MSLSNEQKRQILDDIQRRRGALRPRDVVEEARDPSHPLHDHFEWDDARAGQMYREQQARELLQTVYVRLRQGEVQLTVPNYVRDPRAPATEQGYVSVVKIRTERELAADAIRAEFERARSAMRRARDLAKALGMTEDVDGLLAELERLAGIVPVAA